VTPRLSHFALCWLLTALMLVFGLGLRHTQAAAENVEIIQAHLEPSEDGYRLSSTFNFELNRGLEDALGRGFSLYFTTDVEITRRRWYWFDETAQSSSQTIRISYDLLTRRYNAAIYQPSSTGRLQQNFQTLDDALSLVRRPSRWVVADKGALKAGEPYLVGVRMRLDLAQLSKPFQVHALNNSDWRLSSDWKYFTYKAE
jgi:hypothetical protein